VEYLRPVSADPEPPLIAIQLVPLCSIALVLPELTVDTFVNAEKLDVYLRPVEVRTATLLVLTATAPPPKLPGLAPIEAVDQVVMESEAEYHKVPQPRPTIAALRKVGFQDMHMSSATVGDADARNVAVVPPAEIV
jgi:hypothetical protein